MHKHRAAARYSAWYTDENERSLNPFQKINGRRRRKTEEEDGLQATKTNQSESAFQNSIELMRRRQDDVSPRPPHANTMPSTAGGGGPSTIKEAPGEEEPKDPSQDSGTGTSQTMVEEEEPSSLRKRLHLSGHQHRSNGELERTETTESKKPKQKFTFMGQLRATLFNSYINILLVAVPAGIAVNYAKVNPVAIFVVNFIGIIPLAAMLSYATEEIALRTGETIGGLLNATFGNAVELIVSIIALVAKPPEIIIVQTSLIGSMLSNLLLVMGMCFFFGGLNRVEQHFNVVVAQTASSLLSLAVGSLIIPAAFQAWAAGADEDKSEHITALSRGTSVLLLLVYGAYLFFQLRTHTDIYNAPSEKVDKRRTKVEGGDATKSIAAMGANISATAGGGAVQENPWREPEEKEEPQLHIWVAVFTLGASTALVALCAEYMVDSINALCTPDSSISKTFVGLILLPIVGNAAEHATAVTVACKDKMDLAIGVAVGSSMQISLLVVPFIVVLGWILNIDAMNLDFDGFQIAVLFVTVLLVNYLIQDGKSHWLEGVLLMTLYLIIAVAAWYYPAVDSPTSSASS